MTDGTGVYFFKLVPPGHYELSVAANSFAQYEQKNAAIVGVSVDSFESHQKFCTKEGLNFKLLADPDAMVSAKYGSAMNLPGTKMASRNTFIINPTGQIAKVFSGVKAAGQSDEVLKALAELKKK